MLFRSHTLPSFDDAKQVLSLPPNAPNHDEQLDRTSGLSLEIFLVSGVLIRVMFSFGVKSCFCNGKDQGGLRRLTETYLRWVK